MSISTDLNKANSIIVTTLGMPFYLPLLYLPSSLLSFLHHFYLFLAMVAKRSQHIIHLGFQLTIVNFQLDFLPLQHLQFLTESHLCCLTHFQFLYSIYLSFFFLSTYSLYSYTLFENLSPTVMCLNSETIYHLFLPQLPNHHYFYLRHH